MRQRYQGRPGGKRKGKRKERREKARKPKRQKTLTRPPGSIGKGIPACIYGSQKQVDQFFSSEAAGSRPAAGILCTAAICCRSNVQRAGCSCGSSNGRDMLAFLLVRQGNSRVIYIRLLGYSGQVNIEGGSCLLVCTWQPRLILACRTQWTDGFKLARAVDRVRDCDWQM